MSGWHRFRKRVFWACTYQSVWIDLGGGVPEIDLPRSRDGATGDCLFRFGNWAITRSTRQFLPKWRLKHISALLTEIYFCHGRNCQPFPKHMCIHTERQIKRLVLPIKMKDAFNKVRPYFSLFNINNFWRSSKHKNPILMWNTQIM